MSNLHRAHRFQAGALLTFIVSVALAITSPGSTWAAGGVEATEFGIIAGKVTDRLGAPQAGVPVSILSPGGRVVARAITETSGRFTVSQLRPGIYSAEVVSPSFLPYLKAVIAVKAGALFLLDVSLYKLAESIELNIPVDVQRATEDWKSVLRAQHPTRPILRFQQEPDASPSTVAGAGRAEREPHERALHGTVKLTAGDRIVGFGQDSWLQTSFDMDYQLTSDQSLGLTGSAGLKQGTPATSFHASWNRQEGDIAVTHLTATVRQLFLPREYWVRQFGPNAGQDDRIQSATLGYAQERRISGSLSAEYGALLDYLSLGNRSRRLSTFGRLSYTTPQTGVISVSYTGVGPRAMPTGWDAQKQGSDEWLAIPQISAGTSGEPALETGRHAELSWENSITTPWAASRLQTEAAVFLDALRAPALTAAFDSAAQAMISGSLRDPYTDRHFVSGNGYRSPGVRVAASMQINPAATVISSYSNAGALVASAPGIYAEDGIDQIRNALRMLRTHSFMVKLDSQVPASHTRIISSYRWIPSGAATVPDLYNRGMGQADPYLSVYVLQPLPSPDILPGQFAAVADFTNLLAEGYIPIRSSRGAVGTLYPAARIFRGGFNFTF